MAIVAVAVNTAQRQQWFGHHQPRPCQGVFTKDFTMIGQYCFIAAATGTIRLSNLFKFPGDDIWLNARRKLAGCDAGLSRCVTFVVQQKCPERARIAVAMAQRQQWFGQHQPPRPCDHGQPRRPWENQSKALWKPWASSSPRCHQSLSESTAPGNSGRWLHKGHLRRHFFVAPWTSHWRMQGRWNRWPQGSSTGLQLQGIMSWKQIAHGSASANQQELKGSNPCSKNYPPKKTHPLQKETGNQ